jgi:CheY-like chemotaxis protein
MKSSKAKTVLVVEDETDIRRFARRLLELEGYNVLEAANGNECLHLIRNTPNLSMILLDLRLPGRDGWEVMDEMKKDSRLSKIPVVVFSASAAEWQRKKALSKGAVGYLVKPLDAVNLREAVAATTHWEEVMSGANS